MRNLLSTTISCLAAGLLASCAHSPYKAGSVTKAVAAIRPVGAADGPAGSAWLAHEGRYVRIAVRVSGLTPDAYHGVQLDELGGCEGRGPEGIYDPQGHYHAGPAAIIRRVGNLGNMKTDANGNGELHISINNATINGDDNPLLGRSITINEQKDDLKSDPHGGLGKIVACGVIGVAPEAAVPPKIWYRPQEKPREELMPESLLWYVPEKPAASPDAKTGAK